MLEFLTEDNSNTYIKSLWWKNTKFLKKEDAGWGGSASFAGTSFDSVRWFRCESCFKGSRGIIYTYLSWLKVLLCLIFAIYGLFMFVVNCKEVYSKRFKTSNVEFFAKLVINRIPLIFFTKNSVLDISKGSGNTSVTWKVNYMVYCILQLESHAKCYTSYVISDPNVRYWIYNICGSKSLQRLVATTLRFFWEINFPKISRIFWQITTNLSKYLEKYLLRNTFLVKLQTHSLQICQKNEPHYWYFSSNFFTSKKPLFQRKKPHCWNWIAIMLLKGSCSLFLAVAVCSFNWLMVSLLRNNEDSFD